MDTKTKNVCILCNPWIRDCCDGCGVALWSTTHYPSCQWNSKEITSNCLHMDCFVELDMRDTISCAPLLRVALLLALSCDAKSLNIPSHHTRRDKRLVKARTESDCLTSPRTTCNRRSEIWNAHRSRRRHHCWYPLVHFYLQKEHDKSDMSNQYRIRKDI